ncbi:MAG: TAT-variant-translocated molybdopterin oxidoreductase [Verrucomicrobiota bacterium]|nr:TAT-variant-translocated molybdopterin oxidoreductase [Verrucomicrobiota bacterium]
MKRVVSHPPAPTSGRRYWRSTGELSDTPEFRSWLEREFPSGAAQLNGDEWSRRSFMKLMGASVALAGFGIASCRRPEMHLVPFTKSVEWTIPGKPLYYATAMPRRNGGIPLLVTTVDGRPIKLDGNPLHPAAAGGSDAFVQASILDLYNPMRAQRFAEKGDTRDAAAFEKYLAGLRGKISADGGAGLAFLVEETHSPTRERLRDELAKSFPQMRWCVYEPISGDAQNFATKSGFGENTRLVPKVESADVILALDSDFLDCGEGGIATAKAFSSRRRVGSAKDAMNRLYVVENRFTLTGAMADHRLRLPASQIPAFAHALATKIASATNDAGLSGMLSGLAAAAFEAKWLEEAANDLISKSGASLVLAGPHQPVLVQMLVHGINAALKNIGRTLLVREFPKNPRDLSILALADAMAKGSVKQLFILGSNPAFTAPLMLATDPQSNEALDWSDLQKRVPDVVRLGYYEDETSALSQWNVPATHFLESWGDALSGEGHHLAIQPMILPLFGGWSELDLMNALLGQPKVEGPELVQESFRATNPPGDPAAAWSNFLHDGFASHVELRDRAPNYNGAGAAEVRALWQTPPAPTAESPEIVLVRDYSIDDGRYINNAWLQEMPDPITKLTWDNAALISPKYAKALGVGNGDLIKISVTDAAKKPDGSPIVRELVAATLVAPGAADFSLTLSLGYGRDSMTGAGEHVGFNAYLLRTAKNPHIIVADGKNVASVQVAKVAGTYPLSITQDHFSIEGRGLVREATLERYREDNNFVKKIAGDDELPKVLPTLYVHPPLTSPQQWGMAVDLNTCTGCSACVIACQAENNVPVVGKLQVSHGRAMHWLRIDRYFASEHGYDQDRGQWPEDPEIVHEPMMCQHCENAPCETVCPVNATVHSEDGLNVMAYNRCIGTRYCANNCPFKVRRFNFFDYNQRPVGKEKIAGALNVYKEYLGPLTTKGAPDTIKLSKNPNVTVRMRGVMEKCTMCVQRIEEAKIKAHVHAGASDKTLIPRDSFTTACAQACPSDAIVFGDVADPESRVSKIKAQDRNYRLLEYLNVKTRVSYLARIRNPNPKMPDAKAIGVASPVEEEEAPVSTGEKHS